MAAMPRASLRSVFFTGDCALIIARICRVSTQIAGKPASVSPFHSQMPSGQLPIPPA